MAAITDLTARGLEVAAGATAKYRAVLRDEDKTPIPGGALASLTLTLADWDTRAIINGVSGVNVLNTDRGQIDASGNLTITLGSVPNQADTALTNGGDQQDRALILDFTYNSGASRGRH